MRSLGYSYWPLLYPTSIDVYRYVVVVVSLIIIQLSLKVGEVDEEHH